MKAAIKRLLISSRPGLLLAIALHPRRAATRSRRLRPTRCSFCGRSNTDVQRLIAGKNGVAICNRCVRLCEEILSEEGVTPV